MERGSGKLGSQQPLPKGLRSPQGPFPPPTNTPGQGARGALAAPLTFLSITNSFSAAVRLLISTSNLRRARERGEHGHGDRSVPQMLTKQLVITSVLRAAGQRLQSEVHAPLHSLPPGGGTRTTLKGSISSSSVQKQSGNAPVRKAARGFHCPTSLSQLPAPRDGIKTHPSTTGHLSAVH